MLRLFKSNPCINLTKIFLRQAMVEIKVRTAALFEYCCSKKAKSSFSMKNLRDISSEYRWRAMSSILVCY